MLLLKDIHLVCDLTLYKFLKINKHWIDIVTNGFEGFPLPMFLESWQVNLLYFLNILLLCGGRIVLWDLGSLTKD